MAKKNAAPKTEKPAVEKKERKKPVRVPAELFVKTWVESETLAEVSTKLGISKQCVLVKASALRKMGVGLKSFSRKAKVDVSSLNALLQESGKFEPIEKKAA
jgi:hypothetical protein